MARFRGHSVPALAAACPLHEVAALIWTGRRGTPVADTDLHVIAGGSAPPGLPFAARAQCVLPLVAASDASRASRSRIGRARTGWRVVNLLASIAVDSAELEPLVEQTLARHWTAGPGAAERIRGALISRALASGDEAMAAVRCVARAGADPYGVVITGLTVARPGRGSAIEKRLALPHGAGTVIDLIGRSIRWIGECIE
jgi:hypothetical protein